MSQVAGLDPLGKACIIDAGMSLQFEAQANRSAAANVLRNRFGYVFTQQPDFEPADAADLVLQTVCCQLDADLPAFAEGLGLLHLDESCEP